MQQDVQLLADQIRSAAQSNSARPLRIRGGGTKDFLGAALQGEVLDTCGLNQVVAYEPTELVVTVGAGMRLVDLAALLAEKQQSLPCDPPRFGEGATVGGAIASALSGPARASVGAMKDFVLGIKMLDASGTELTFGGQVMKNVAGYDVSRLMVGSWGTLGLLTEVSLKVLPVALAEANLRLVCSQAQALDYLNYWGGQPLPLNASVWTADASGAGTLLIRLRGAVAAVDAACQRMAAYAAGEGVACAPMELSDADAPWTSCREQTHAFFNAPGPDDCLWRLSVAQVAPPLPLRAATFVEWHGAQRWVWAPATAAADVRRVASEAGGHAMLFRTSATHGEADRSVGVFHPTDANTAGIAERLRAQLDPAGVFNTARV